MIIKFICHIISHHPHPHPHPSLVDRSSNSRARTHINLSPQKKAIQSERPQGQEISMG